MLIHIGFTSWFFRKLVAADIDGSGLIMELPPYHKPNWRTIFTYVKNKMSMVLVRASKVVIGVSVLMWVWSYSPDGHIENSWAYASGKFIEPVGAFFGLEWRLFIAFVFSAMGKESALGVIAMLFGAGGGIASFSGAMIPGALQFSQANLSTALLASVSRPEALAFLYAFFFNVPCMAVMASVKIETHSSKWTLILAVYYVLTALILGGIAYQVGKAVW